MTTIRTSLSHPILVNWLSGIPEGRVGLTFAPGKHSTSVYIPGALWRRDLATDLDELVRQGVTDLVCLLQDRDLRRLKIPHLVQEATARGLRVHRLPIADQGVPGSRKALVELLATVQQRLAEGASVVIHCEGGRGRTGGDVRGYLAHIEGVGWQMEWFATRALWEASAVRLLRALAVEALGATAGEGRAPGVEDARRWLESAALLDEVQQEQAGAAARRQRGQAGLAMVLTLWPGSQTLHGVVAS